MADDIRPQVQTSLGDAYTIERELGGGGMSRTYVAMERSLARRVVVKVLSPELAAGVSVDRFKREILLAAQMQHPHVVPVLSSGDASGLPWFTMPFVEGESLRARLVRGPLPTTEAVSVLRDVARALAFAHARGVVHRDIKPDNVLLSEGSATVTDFGIAKAISAARTGGGGETLTMAGTSIGTPAYMAPEQAAGDPNIDHRSDIYAFGCMAYEVLTGRPPFTGQSPAKLLGAHLGEKPRDVRELRADTPESLAALVMQSLEKDPALRPQMASDLVRVLDTVTSSGASPAAPGILAGRIPVGKALAYWAIGATLVGLTAWAATVVIGLPDWVLPGSIGVMLAGLPIIAFTAWVQRVAHRSYTATPTFTPGGSSTAAQGTLHTLAIKASPHVSWRRTWMGGAVAVGAFVVLVVGWMVMRALGIGPAGSLLGAGKLAPNDQIIITDFRSPANDSTLGVTVAEALRADVAESSILRVLPRLAVMDILRLMQRPTDSRIDFDLARTIASREGLKAILDGDIVSLGGRYRLTTRLISAQDGAQLATFTEDAESQNDLIPAIGRLGKQLRSKAGESLKDVREASALERVTTSSLDALRKYTNANLIFDRTGDYAQAIPVMSEAVQLDSTFAMAWRRLAMWHGNMGRFERSQEAASRAFQYSDRLSDVERHLTVATYYTNGPEADDERALAAYQSALERDSLNTVALNNASLILARRREWEKSLEYRLRGAAQPGATPQNFSNALSAAATLGRWELMDSLQREWARRYPTNPAAQFAPARGAAARGEFDLAEQLEKEVLPRLQGSQTAMVNHLGFSAELALVRGKVGESLQMRTEQRDRQRRAGSTVARLSIGFDSVLAAATALEDPVRARVLLERAIRRAPLDSVPYVERNYVVYLSVAALAGDTLLARQWHRESRESWERSGRSVDRPAWESFDDAMLALAEGRNDEAMLKLREADQRNLPNLSVLHSLRFVVLNRMQAADSAIAAGEEFLEVTSSGRLGQDALFLAGIRQRLGEMYEAKGNVDKALTHYTAFVELWKNADPELQPRVRDVRGRIERLQRRRG